MKFVVGLICLALFFETCGPLIAKILGLFLPTLLAAPAPVVPAPPARTAARNSALVDAEVENVVDVHQAATVDDGLQQVQRDALVSTQSRNAELVRESLQARVASLEPEFDYSDFRPAGQESFPVQQGVVDMFHDSEVDSATA